MKAKAEVKHGTVCFLQPQWHYDKYLEGNVYVYVICQMKG